MPTSFEENTEVITLDGKKIGKVKRVENNDYFIVEKNQNGLEFQKIGYVSGNGSSSQHHYYNFTDTHPLNGGNYYRLQQIDFDGTVTYSNIIRMEHTSDENIAAIMYSGNGNFYLQTISTKFSLHFFFFTIFFIKNNIKIWIF